MQRNVATEKPDTFQSFTSRRSASTLVVGLGNPILGDDGIGWHVAGVVDKWLRETNAVESVEVDCVSLGGLSLMERLIGYERAIIIDAISTGQWPLGSVHRFPLSALSDLAANHSGSAHDTSLKTALAVGKSMGARLPDEIVIVAVEAQSIYEFSEELTPAIATALPEAARRVIEALGFSDLRHAINEED